jgi:hypothetical protein
MLAMVDGMGAKPKSATIPRFAPWWQEPSSEGDSQVTLLLLAEAAIAGIAIERFLRAVLSEGATEKDTVYNLLQKATSGDPPLLVLPWNTQENGCREISKVRNTLLHGNFAQAAREANYTSVEHYFKTQFAGEAEKLFETLDELALQFDTYTGRPLHNRTASQWAGKPEEGR